MTSEPAVSSVAFSSAGASGRREDSAVSSAPVCDDLSICEEVGAGPVCSAACARG